MTAVYKSETNINKKTAFKNCTLCRRSLPFSNFYKKGSGLHSYCKQCHWDRTRELRAMKINAPVVVFVPKISGMLTFNALIKDSGKGATK